MGVKQILIDSWPEIFYEYYTLGRYTPNYILLLYQQNNIKVKHNLPSDKTLVFTIRLKLCFSKKKKKIKSLSANKQNTEYYLIDNTLIWIKDKDIKIID